MTRRGAPAWAWLLPALPLALAACAAGPVGAVRVPPADVDRELTANALTAGRPSTTTRAVLADALLAEPEVSSAVDNMSPRHVFIQTLHSIPVADEVVAHSIISVAGDGPVETGDDGVVAYASAHVPGVESERVVRSSHSTQGHPETIAEVHRILLGHAERP